MLAIVLARNRDAQLHVSREKKHDRLFLKQGDSGFIWSISELVWAPLFP